MVILGKKLSDFRLKAGVSRRGTTVSTHVAALSHSGHRHPSESTECSVHLKSQEVYVRCFSSTANCGMETRRKFPRVRFSVPQGGSHLRSPHFSLCKRSECSTEVASWNPFCISLTSSVPVSVQYKSASSQHGVNQRRESCHDAGTWCTVSYCSPSPPFVSV